MFSQIEFSSVYHLVDAISTLPPCMMVSAFSFHSYGVSVIVSVAFRIQPDWTPLDCQDSLHAVISTVTKKMVCQAMRQVAAKVIFELLLLLMVNVCMEVNHFVLIVLTFYFGWHGSSKCFQFWATLFFESVKLKGKMKI